MPRTLPAALQTAMDSQNISAYFKVGVGDAGITNYITDIFSFKIQPLSIEVSLYAFDPTINLLNIERGSIINGTKVGIVTSSFHATSFEMQKNIWTIKADIFPKKPVTLLADGTYKAVIEAVCAQFGKTASFFKPTAAWLSYQFFPTGKNLTLNDATKFFNLLKQKYLIFATDNGSENILFFHYKDLPHTGDHSITDELMKFGYPNESRRLMSRDENATVHYSGLATNPIHNLGFLHSTALHPSQTTAPKNNNSLRLFPHLKYLTGDIFVISSQGGLYSTNDLMKTEESFNPELSPAWGIEIKDIEVFSNTEGGALPSTIERVAAYTPLVTTGFDKNLTSTVNNLQALAEAVDDLVPIITIDPVAPADGELWLLRETVGAVPNGSAIGMMSFTYTGNTGTVAPLKLSVNDNGVTRRLAFP